MLLSESVGLGDEHDSLLNMIDGWSHDVLRFRAELDLAGEAREWWGLFDLVAAYYTRERIESVVTANNLTVPAVVSATDELLKASFVFREFDWQARTSQKPGLGWWWGWLPPRGPLGKEVNEWDQPS
jgi:hypothetical protein